MKATTKVWILALTIFIVFFALGLILPRLLGLESMSFWILLWGLWVLGLIAALILWFWRMPAARAKAELEPDAKADEIDVTLAAARKRLASARGKSGARLGRIPVILVAGPSGSAKSTIIDKSGLEPELLAGEVHRGGAVIPTSAINVWIAQDNLIVEAGGKLAGEAGRFTRLVRHIRPSRLRAMLPGGKQAPRAMVVCFGCDELLKPGASETVPAAAQKLRARLAEVSQQLGVRLPVYVLFTKADRLPYFEDFVRNLTREEARDVLGVTFTVPPAVSVGTYAEQESKRLADAFRNLFRGLALRRLEVLPRETSEEVRAGVYEFPREFRKIRELATHFLLDICRPSQLGIGPFLRGFYFTGVRPIYIHDVASAGPQPHAPGALPASDATAVFDPRQLQQAAPAPMPTPGSRKVPEWVFHERVFQEIILSDDVVRGVTAGGTKVNFLRRAAFATAAAACLVFATGFTWSFVKNRAFLNRVQAAITGVGGLVLDAPAPDLPTLQALDTLRAHADTLNRYARDENKPEWGKRWWLYAGDKVQPVVDSLYFDRFRAVMWDDTKQALVDSLSRLPDTPTQADAYGRTFDALKAYILMASQPTLEDTTTDSFLPPVLDRFWPAAGLVAADTPRAELADSQFGFYSRELEWKNPYGVLALDNDLVASTRSYLCGFAGSEALYRMLLSQAGAASQPVRWTDRTVTNSVVVPAAFTAAGWDEAQAMLGDVDALFDRESWVTGDGCPVPPDERAALQQQLQERYETEYIARWTSFLEGGRVQYAGIRDAAAKLTAISSPASPLLGMLRTIADNTAVDTARVGKAFAPVQAVAPANATSLSEAATAYVTGLARLQAAIAQVAGGQGQMRQQAEIAANSEETALRSQITGLGSSFNIDGDARLVGAGVTALLLRPLDVGGEITAAAAGEVNEKGAQFCAPFDAVLTKYPFDSRAAVEATLDEVVTAFQPNQGAMWTFFQDELGDLLTRQGNRVVAKSGVSPQAHPDFVRFFNLAAQVSSAFFAQNSASPYVAYSLRPETSTRTTEVTVSLGGQTRTITRGQAAFQVFDWNGSSASDARITATIDGSTVTVVEAPPGPWATFRLFHSARSFDREGSEWRVVWQVPGQEETLSALLRFDDGPAIFRQQFLAQLGRCPTRIAR